MKKNKTQFEVGNNMWERRSSIGRKPIFKTPSKMWAAACEYFEWCVSNPWQKHDIKAADKELHDVYIDTARPFTWAGFCVFIGTSQQYFNQFKNGEAYKKTPAFSQVISQIDSVMYSQKFEGAAVGAFNSNIISRELGLADKTQSENLNVNMAVVLTKEEVKEYADILNKEI